jgi:hypothetical protein
MTVQLAHRHAPALDGLQEDAAAVTQDAGDAAQRVGAARLVRMASIASALVSTARLA